MLSTSWVGSHAIGRRNKSNLTENPSIYRDPLRACRTWRLATQDLVGFVILTPFIVNLTKPGRVSAFFFAVFIHVVLPYMCQAESLVIRHSWPCPFLLIILEMTIKL